MRIIGPGLATSSTSRARRPRRAPPRKHNDFPGALLDVVASGKTELAFAKGDLIYVQGERADAVFFLVRGRVRLSVLSKSGKEAILGVLSEGDFCGEGCLTAQLRRVGSATAATAVVVIRVTKAALVEALHVQHALSEAFLAQLLARNIALEEDICDQLFNHSEKRLARTLLKLARFGQVPAPSGGHVITPKISQEALAAMVGTTRSRVNFFLSKFRRLGLIEYDGEFRIHPELLTDVVLSE